MSVQIPKEEIADICCRNHIRRLPLFGSVLRDDFTPNGDIDILVEFDPNARVGPIALASMENDLSQLLGRRT